MSDSPTSSRPRSTLPHAVPQGIWYRPDRPKIVGMAGWFCAAIGYVGFIMKGSQLPALFSDMKWLNPEYKPIPYNREQFTIAALILFAEMAIALLCIAGALGTLKMRHWGRRTLIKYALIGAGFTIAKTIWQIHMFDFMLDYQLSVTTQPVDRHMLENRQYFALMVMTGVRLLWFTGLLVLLTNHHIVESFDASEGGRGIRRSDDWESGAGESRS